ncbi:MAG TPA: serine/threonine-protein kinase [Polyangiaceae bacterium]
MTQVHQSVIDLVQARLGRMLKDKWHVDELLGLGGMAAVYSATHRNGSRVAIKMLHPQLSGNDDVRKRFAREGYLANTVGHPGVHRVVDDDVSEDGSAFLVMELLEGETSSARAERVGGKLTPQEVAFIGQGILDVLAAAHANGIIHRDIKPDNIFLTTDNRVVVLDFGIARVMEGFGESGTKTGTMMGTPAFMPPEQARGRANEMDATSDVWAVGATLFYLLTGRVVHEAETANEQLVAAATLPAVSIQRIEPVPTPIADVVDRALSYAKTERYPDARAMQAALVDAIMQISWGGRPPPGFNLARPPSSARAFPVGPPPSGSSPDASSSGSFARRNDITLHVPSPPSHPTLGPVVVMEKSPHRAARVVLALVAGALVAAVAGVGFLAVRGRMTSDTSTTAPAVPHDTATESRLPASFATSTAAAMQPDAAAYEPLAVPSASASVKKSPVPPAATGKKNWLDRRQ